MKLENIREIKGTIKLLTGLHIGAGNEVIEIGGLDQPIIKHPISHEPYIPGSSLKGKMRSSLELYLGRYGENGGPCQCGKPDCPVCTLFGVSGSKKEKESEIEGPTRIAVRDAYMTNKFKEDFDSGELPMEIKYENIINRISGTAEHPRPLERVPADVEFTLNISLKEFDIDKEKKFMNTVLACLRLVEKDGLGGSISRGCGQVKFEIEGIENWEEKAKAQLNKLESSNGD